MKRLITAAAAVALLMGGVACSSGGDTKSATKGEPLVGVFKITAGACDASTKTGSYFFMVEPHKPIDQGPFVENGDSGCATDKSVTLLSPGTDGGLSTKNFQSEPSPAFDASNTNALATRIALPAKFFAVDFAIATNEHDTQTKTDNKLPTISVDGNKLTGDLAAFAATWNGGHYNQGAPKPGGNAEDSTPVTGTYDATTKAFTLEWSSKIVGSSFNNFIGVWHLEGTFVAA